MAKHGLDHLYSKSACCAVPSAIREINKLVDSPGGDLRFKGEHLPPIISLDNSGRVIHMRSTSKTFAPGLRLTYSQSGESVIAEAVAELGKLIKKRL
jgi:aspartate/methionine/tyrosine aminotransferase